MLAAIEPDVATIRQCLGTLVFGEGDDELQDAVVRLFRERGKTLATAECGTAGLVAEWLAGVEGSADVYRGGLVLTDAAAPADALAARCREQFGAHYGLAVGVEGEGKTSPLSLWEGEGEGRTPLSDWERRGGEGSEPPSVTIALASPDTIQTKTISTVIHPELRRIYLAKQALNFIRLTLLTERDRQTHARTRRPASTRRAHQRP